MKRLVLFMHTSLDSFVAGLNGEMDWIHVDDEIFNYAARQTDNADTALYGRKTYEMMEAYWPTAADQPNASRHDIVHSNWYNRVTKLVVSKSFHDKNLTHTKIIGTDIVEEINRSKQQEGKNILMFGSPTVAHSLMEHNLIDDYWIFVNPVVLGKGVPLFANTKLNLRLLSTNAFSSGVVGLHYEKKD